MDLLAKSDKEIFEIGKPFWENLVRSSNMKDYGGFTRDFSTQMLFGANEVELGKQWANNKLITNLNETYEPFGTLRRGDHMKLDDENWHCLTVSRRDPKTGKFSMEKVPVYHIVDENEKKKAS